LLPASANAVFSVGAPGGPAEPVPRGGLLDGAQRLDARALSKLKWRCRRGLLENDLFIERFFRQHEATITRSQATGMNTLMDLADNDLLDLLLRRKEPQGEVDTAEVREVLALLRNPPTVVTN
jgi:antitoxin CptB